MSSPTGNWGIRFPGMHDEGFVLQVKKELDELLMWEAIMVEQEQRELAELYKDNPPARCVDGVGPQVLAITPTAFIHYKAIEQLDFSNPRDIRYLIRRHPHMRVQGAQRVKTGVGYRGPTQSDPKTLHVEQRGAVRSTTNFAE